MESASLLRADEKLTGFGRSAFTDQPPGTDTEQRADEGGDQILEGDFDFAETKVCPESKALFAEGH
jgi:hypothetical protein